MTPKDAVLTIRVEEDVKTKLQEAAKWRDQSLTTFIVEASLKAAEKALESEKVWASLGVKGTRKPSAHFRKLCEEASQGGSWGSEKGWHLVGYKMACSTQDKPLYGAIDVKRLIELKNALARKDRDAVWAWYLDEFPVHMFSVPSKRKDRYLDGVFQAWDDGHLEF
jgi:hypothetical protein